MLKERINKRQAGMIYRAYKLGLVEMTQDEASRMYDLVDYEGYDDNGSVTERIDCLLLAVENIANEDYESANRNLRRAFPRQEEKELTADEIEKIEDIKAEISELKQEAKAAKWSEKRALYNEIENLEKYIKRIENAR